MKWRWPFGFKSTFEEKEAFLREVIAYERRAKDEMLETMREQSRSMSSERQRADLIFDRVSTMLTTAAANPMNTAQLPMSSSSTSLLGEKTHAAIRARGMGKPRQVRENMLAAALELHALGRSDEEIAKAVIHGERIEL